jgi:hypothetical protein
MPVILTKPIIKILLHPEKVKQCTFYHITSLPKSELKLEDFPIEVAFQLPDGKQLDGQLVDAAKYRILDLPHELTRAATGLGNAMFIGNALLQHKKENVEMMVWKGEIFNNKSF